MKRKEPSPHPTMEKVLETFGGDYHRLESDFRPKSALSPAAKLRDDKTSKQNKGKQIGAG
jgi:hypothetical protein